MGRKAIVSGHMFILDHETWPADDETNLVRFSREAEVDADGQPEELITAVGRAGGEVKIELHMNAVLLTAGKLRIRGVAKLFEGTSDNSTDLDGEHSFDFQVRKNKRRTVNFRVHNDDEGGDYADISFTVGNRPLR
ncbi:MAG: hypothetical protein JMDDDDMK_00236 [Acidobacteria bacterium]|nr:hypothetical protein [Acidobacteriota bacterium]